MLRNLYKINKTLCYLQQDAQIQMKANNGKGLTKQLAGILGVIGAGVLMSLPAAAGIMNGNSSGSHQPEYSIGDTQLTKDAISSSSKGMTKQTATRRNIVAIASTNPSFKTLTAALKAAGLTETLSGQGPFTVFAPTDEAFNALPKGTLETLLKPENKAKLVKILTYHVINGKVTSGQLKPGPVNTVEGTPVEVKVTNGRVTVNEAKVTRANIPASNGVIHVIDKVIIPQDAQ